MSKIKIGIKMRVTPEQSRKVQEICFANAIAWLKSIEIKHLDKPFIYINLSKYLGYSDIDDKYFDEDDNEEVSAELFIKTNGYCVESEALTIINKSNLSDDFYEGLEERLKRKLTEDELDKISGSGVIDELLDEMLEKISDKIIEYAENMS